jgi:hypothetical protein
MEEQLTTEDYTKIHRELTQEDYTGRWTALHEDNCSKNNSINRFRRLKALNYFLFKSFSDKPYELWSSDGIKHEKGNLDENDYKKCICGHKIWEYSVVESKQMDRAYIGMCCIKRFDKEWSLSVKEVMKKCPCGKKKVMTKPHCKTCGLCKKCNIIKPMKRLYDMECISCSEKAEQEQRERLRNDMLEMERKNAEARRHAEREHAEYMTTKIKELKEAVDLEYARNDWEQKFTSELLAKMIVTKHPRLSEKQENVLNRILTYGRWVTA